MFLERPSTFQVKAVKVLNFTMSGASTSTVELSISESLNEPGMFAFHNS